ncbi:MAG: DNA cytosine methyltransferase [Gemmataceae bacterium]|nr:DNA cytosine methyltransferase [Gemmataceae bacterium]MCI0739493.1 DNA cytosine methyltransferase [Gemmataceae bacterium]
MTAAKRLIQVNAANLKHSHLYVTGLRDLFPPEAIGGSRRKGSNGHGFELVLDGLGETVVTDIGSDAKTGKARGFLRCRAAIARFYKHHAVKPGGYVELERLAERKYRLRLPRPRAAEFFAGIGLVRLALEAQGWDVVFANDIDADKAAMYGHNWPNDDHFVPGDIHDLKVRNIPDCDLFTASFPCNDLSIAGKWEGLNGKQSSAFWGLIEILRELRERRPPLVLLENVFGFLQRHEGKDFEAALLALNGLGYNVDALILNALNWVPQSRTRLFVIAKRDQGEPRQTAPIECEVRPEPLINFIYTHDQIRWDLPLLPSPPKLRKHLADIVDDLPDDDPNWWNKERTEYFMKQLSPKHASQANEMIRGKLVSYATAFRRVRHGKSMAELRTDGIAGCLRTPRGGSGRQILFKAGKEKYQVRLLTARECARLQGVPDDFHIEVGLNQALFGFGDAVCVPVIEWIAANYLKPALARV